MPKAKSRPGALTHRSVKATKLRKPAAPSSTGLPATTGRSMTLAARIRPEGMSGDEMNASLTVGGLIHNAVLATQFSRSPVGDVALTAGT